MTHGLIKLHSGEPNERFIARHFPAQEIIIIVAASHVAVNGLG